MQMTHHGPHSAQQLSSRELLDAILTESLYADDCCAFGLVRSSSACGRPTTVVRTRIDVEIRPVESALNFGHSRVACVSYFAGVPE